MKNDLEILGFLGVEKAENEMIKQIAKTSNYCVALIKAYSYGKMQGKREERAKRRKGEKQ